MSEADVHFELYRHLQNAIDETPKREGIHFGDVRPEYGENINGFADIVVFDSTGNPIVVIEAKSPNNEGRSRGEVDPYAPKVIRQGFRYAGDLGAPYFCTFNGSRLVIFDAYEEGVPLLQRSTKSYEIESLKKFADTFLDEIAKIRVGDTNWDSSDNAFIKRVRSIHEQITPDLEVALAEHLEGDEEFKDRFYTWTESQGVEYEDLDIDDQKDVRVEFAEQASYLLVNKIIFYKLLEGSPTYSDQIEPLAVSPFRVQEDLQEYFTQIVQEIDFEAILEHDEIYSEIPLESVADRIREYIIELDDQNLQQFDSDVIGRIYEGVIPAERRHEMGEYYTPPAICDLITRLTIDKSDDRVLDPGCGSGGFLISSYNRKSQLMAEEAGVHSQLLQQIYGIDINRFPAHLSSINLAIQDLSSYTEDVNVEVANFFDVEPDMIRFGREEAGPGGSSETSSMIMEGVGGFDVVVGNPPYRKFQNINQKEKVRSHLENVDAKYLSGFSDIYCYFFTHATQFLKEGGRLGYIVSDRWLNSRYGEDIQQFLLDNYKIETVMRFASEAFDDALIGSTIIIAERCAEEQERGENRVKFLKIRDRMDLESAASLVEQKIDSDKTIVSDEYWLLAATQETIDTDTSWSLYYDTPPVYFELQNSDDMCELQEVANLYKGKKVGGNNYFYRRSEEWEELGLDEFTYPVIKATGQIEKIRFDDRDAEEWGVLDVRNLVREALNTDQKFGDDNLNHVKKWLKKNGYTDLLEYIQEGEKQDQHEHSSCESRDVWFNIDDLDQYVSCMAMGEFLWTHHRIAWNEADALVDYQFHCIDPAEGVTDKLLGGILNSRVTWLTRELEGRQASGASMTRARMTLYEAEEMSIVDPRQLDEEDKQRRSSVGDC